MSHLLDLLQDTRYAVRLLRRAPGFTVAATACLAIGTGLTAAMYAQVKATVLRDIPGVGDAAGLVRFHAPTSYPYYEEIRDRAAQLRAVTAYMAPIPVAVSHRGGAAQRVWGHLVSAEYFDVLGVRPVLGRTFSDAERVRGSGNVVVLSDRLWRSRFGADASVVGESLRVNGERATIVGVAPAGFLGASPMTSAADIWIPATAPAGLAPELGTIGNPRVAAVDVVGRLAPGVSIAHAEQALETLVRRLDQEHGDPARDSQERRVRLLPGGRMFPVRNEDLPRAVGFPLVLVSLVLLMACGNVANMILARNAARRREVAVRLSVGASRGRIIRQLLAEGLLLAVVGAVSGAIFAVWLLSIFDSLRPVMPGYVDFQVPFDWTGFASVTILATVVSLLFAVVPALRASRQDLYAGLKPAAASTLRSHRWFGLRNLLVFQQVAVSVVLVLLTAFIVVGWRRAASVDVGYDPHHLYFVSLDPIRDGSTPEHTREFIGRVLDRLRLQPGIVHVSVAQTVPLAMSGSELMLGARSDFAAGTKSLGATRAERVGAGFFATIGTPVLSGRDFREDEHTDRSRALLVNRTMAAEVWPGEDAVGRTLSLDGETWQVVGVVGDIRSAFPLAPTLPAVYRPVTPSGFASPSRHGVTIAVRVTPGIDAAALLRREIETVDPKVTVVQVKRMSEEVEQTFYLARFAAYIYGGMGIFGLILASVGLAGVTAYTVARRTHEIGIRIALGASKRHVLSLVLREGTVVAAAGTIVGVAGALAATRALASVLDALADTTRTSMSDPALLVGGPGLLAALALVASYVPARRALRVDPVTSLRAE